MKFAPSGSSFTKFVAVTERGVCVCARVSSAVAKREEVRDGVGILQAGEGISLGLPKLQERPCMRAPRVVALVASLRSPWLARINLPLSTPPPSRSARLFPPSFWAPAGTGFVTAS